MPHTSHRRKKQQQQRQCQLHRNKRGEIESHNGWTQIARSGKALSINMQDNYQIVHLPPNDPSYDSDQDEGETRLTFDCTPAEIPEGASLEKALNHYRKCEATWKQSNTGTELKKILEARVLGAGLTINNAICFGLSSPTGLILPGVDRRNASMYQLTAFKSVIDILSEKQDGPLEAFAQEPVFNTLDIALLSHLHIKVVQHPEAFHRITFNSFTFCPGAEQFVVRGTLFRNPAMHMGSGALETYFDPNTGDIRSPHIGSIFVYDCQDTRPLTDQHDAEDVNSPEENRPSLQLEQVIEDEKGRVPSRVRAMFDAVRGAGILHHFKKDKESYKLADTENFDWALYNTHLFWRSSTSLVDD